MLIFLADPSDIIEARRRVRLSLEYPGELDLLIEIQDLSELDTEYFFKSEGEIFETYL